MVRERRRFELDDSANIDWIDGYATLPSPPIRPLQALRSVMRLVENKEETSQVFEVVSALEGDSVKRVFRQFIKTPYGKRVIDEPIRLEEILGDVDALSAMQEGSVGRTFYEFMKSGDLSPDGLIDIAEEAGLDYRSETEFEHYRRMYLHISIYHDLFHVLSGYGRDALGEICNLVFTGSQFNNNGWRLIILTGAIAQKLEQPKVKILSSLMEARRNAKAVRPFLDWDVEDMLPRSLSEVRERINIGPTPIYDSIPVEVKKALMKPAAILEAGGEASSI